MTSNNLQPEGWEAWKLSNEGKECLAGSTTGKYLENRLWRAFHAGKDAEWKKVKGHYDLGVTAERTRCIKEIEGMKKDGLEDDQYVGWVDCKREVLKIIKNEK